MVKTTSEDCAKCHYCGPHNGIHYDPRLKHSDEINYCIKQIKKMTEFDLKGSMEERNEICN
jgi:hypothetical protein